MNFIFYASLLLLCEPLGVAGFCSSVASSKFLICESSDSLFFFCFLTSDAGRSSSGWPVLLFGVVWINGCFNRPFNSYTHQLAQLDGVSSKRLNLVSLVQLSPLFWRRRSSTRISTQTLERSSGTRQLRNWCKDAIYNPHTLANFKLVFSVLEKLNLWVVATWLILPVVICLS